MRLRDMPVYSGTRQDLEISYHRYRCQSCARTFCEEIPFRHPETRISERAASWISSFLRFSIPIFTVQKLTGVHWETIKHIQKEIMDEAVAGRRRKLLMEGYKPKHLAVDEFAIHKGHRYATCVMDLDTGDVLWVGKGRTKADFSNCFHECVLSIKNGEKFHGNSRKISKFMPVDMEGPVFSLKTGFSNLNGEKFHIKFHSCFK